MSNKEKTRMLYGLLFDVFSFRKIKPFLILLIAFIFYLPTHATEVEMPENLDVFEINYNGAKLRYAKVINEMGIDNSSIYTIQIYDKYNNLKTDIRTNLSPGCEPNYKAIENISIPVYYKDNSYRISIFIFCGSDKGHSSTVWFVNSENLELLGRILFLKNTVNFSENRNNDGIFSIQSIPYRIDSKSFTGIIFYKKIYHIGIDQNSGNFLLSPFLYDRYRDSYEQYLEESLDKVSKASKASLSSNEEYLEQLVLAAIYSHFSDNKAAHCQVKSDIPVDIYRAIADSFSFFHRCN